jgi:hypothetical protein
VKSVKDRYAYPTPIFHLSWNLHVCGVRVHNFRKSLADLSCAEINSWPPIGVNFIHLYGQAGRTLRRVEPYIYRFGFSIQHHGSAASEGGNWEAVQVFKLTTPFLATATATPGEFRQIRRPRGPAGRETHEPCSTTDGSVFPCLLSSPSTNLTSTSRIAFI